MNQSPNQDAPTVIHITNLDASVNFMDLMTVFCGFDGYRSSHVAQELTKTGQYLTLYGTVAFFDSESAAKAKAEMNGYMLRGKPMVVGFEEPSNDWIDKMTA